MSCGKECENCGQVGGDGYGMSMTENIAGQPVVEAYNCCDNPSVPAANVADATNQVGGGVNPFNFIINPVTGARLSLFSSGGKALLKNMIRQYKAGGEGGDTTEESELVGGPGTPAEESELVGGPGTPAEESELVGGPGTPAEESELVGGPGTPAAEEEVVGGPVVEPGTKTDTDEEVEEEVEEEKTSSLEDATKDLRKTVDEKDEDIVELANKAIDAAKNYKDDNKEEALGAARKFLEASRGTNGVNPEDEKVYAQDKLEGVIEELSGGKDVSKMGGGAPAEMTDAFGEDYFNTEADALRGSWD